MISDEQRRSFAESLRYISQNPPEWATSACAIAEVFDADYPLWSDSGELFAMLADLIDRPTCFDTENKDSKFFACGACGFSDSQITVNPFTLGIRCVKPSYRYCPNCGAEVVE